MTEYNHLTDPLRNRRITASMVGACLGENPWMTPEDAMRSMVRDALGAEREFEGNVATSHGNASEDGACLEFQMETGLSVEKARFVVREDWAGATVDGWVSDGAILEIKSPYRLRKDPAPVAFKTLAEQPHYFSQVQFQLWVTEHETAHFFQWTPNDTRLETVAVDQGWRDDALPRLRQFYARFLTELDNPDHLSPRRTVIDTPEAAQKLRAYTELKEQIELAEERRKEILSEIVEMCGHKNALFAGAKVTETRRKGQISYSKAIKALKIKADFEPYRGAGSSFWGITE